MSDKLTNEQLPNSLKYLYVIRFIKTDKTYRLDHFNSPHESVDKALDDIRVFMEGVDLQGHALPAYKVVDWEKLEAGTYDLDIEAWYYRKDTKTPYDQHFKVMKLEKAK